MGSMTTRGAALLLLRGRLAASRRLGGGRLAAGGRLGAEHRLGGRLGRLHHTLVQPREEARLVQVERGERHLDADVDHELVVLVQALLHHGEGRARAPARGGDVVRLDEDALRRHLRADQVRHRRDDTAQNAHDGGEADDHVVVRRPLILEVVADPPRRRSEERRRVEELRGLLELVNIGERRETHFSAQRSDTGIRRRWASVEG
eukprot:scaffold27658_cov72-Phaeocystis_antarctica.AAC.2